MLPIHPSLDLLHQHIPEHGHCYTDYDWPRHVSVIIQTTCMITCATTQPGYQSWGILQKLGHLKFCVWVFCLEMVKHPQTYPLIPKITLGWSIMSKFWRIFKYTFIHVKYVVQRFVPRDLNFWFEKNWGLLSEKNTFLQNFQCSRARYIGFSSGAQYIHLGAPFAMVGKKIGIDPKKLQNFFMLFCDGSH